MNKLLICTDVVKNVSLDMFRKHNISVSPVIEQGTYNQSTAEVDI